MFKKDDVVLIPKDTPLLRATPDLLTKEAIQGTMHYDGVGKIDTIRDKSIVAVAIWDAGRSSPWYANFKAKDLKPAKNVKLGYDFLRDQLTVTENGVTYPTSTKPVLATGVIDICNLFENEHFYVHSNGAIGMSRERKFYWFVWDGKEKAYRFVNTTRTKQGAIRCKIGRDY